MADECICNNTECWGYTCPVHRIVCRAEVPKRGRPLSEYERGYSHGLQDGLLRRPATVSDSSEFMRGYRDGMRDAREIRDGA